MGELYLKKQKNAKQKKQPLRCGETKGSGVRRSRPELPAREGPGVCIARHENGGLSINFGTSSIVCFFKDIRLSFPAKLFILPEIGMPYFETKGNIFPYREMDRRRDVFPPPLGPIIQKVDPGVARRDISLRILFFPTRHPRMKHLSSSRFKLPIRSLNPLCGGG
jgi:hypothetical protein